MANCQLIPRCLECAENHKTRKCVDQNITLKCINCDGSHSANSTEYPKYQIKLKNITQRRRINAPPRSAMSTPHRQPTIHSSSRTAAQKYIMVKDVVKISRVLIKAGARLMSSYNLFLRKKNPLAG